MKDIMDWIGMINGFLWGQYTFFILLGAGILFTIWTKFIQYTSMTHGVAVLRGKFDHATDTGAISHFQALSAALSATIGLGNIAGVALAISLGGPGALLWMWVIGLFGMAIKAVEITLAMVYRNTDEPENPHGGAMWVVHKTLVAKGGPLAILGRCIAVFFCFSLLVMSIGGGGMFQSWNVADITNVYFSIPKWITGVILSILVGFVIIGGIKRIGTVAARLVPFMCVAYIVAALAVVAIHIQDIPGLLVLVIQSAFSSTQASGAFLGGAAGLAFSVGLQRAFFSNEAGMGSAPIVHAAAKTNEPAREGILGGIGPLIDTLIICTLTALVILATGTWNRPAIGELDGSVVSDDNRVKMSLNLSSDIEQLPAARQGESWQVGDGFFVATPWKVLFGKRRGQFGRVHGVINKDKTISWEEIEWEMGDISQHFADNAPVSVPLFRERTGAALTSYAFDQAFPGLGKWLVPLACWLFAMSTMISWSYYGEQGVIYLLGNNKMILTAYKIVFLVLCALVPFLVETGGDLGSLADFSSGWMLWANVPIMLCLGYLAIRYLDDYRSRLRAGEFTPKRP